jgi:putative NADH-flavin reductase
MRITIFGATGRTGRHLVEQALEAGHEVVALARTPSKLSIDNHRLSIVQGDIQDAKAVEEVVAGADAVISVLGPMSNEPVYEVSRGMENILVGMENQGVSRLVQSIGAAVGDPSDQPKILDRAIKALLKLMSRYVYEDMVRVNDQIRASDLDWTLVRVPMLTDDPLGGDLRVGNLGQGLGPRVSRSDLAAFMLRQVDNDTYRHQAPVISN